MESAAHREQSRRNHAVVAAGGRSTAAPRRLLRLQMHPGCFLFRCFLLSQALCARVRKTSLSAAERIIRMVSKTLLHNCCRICVHIRGFAECLCSAGTLRRSFYTHRQRFIMSGNDCEFTLESTNGVSRFNTGFYSH